MTPNFGPGVVLAAFLRAVLAGRQAQWRVSLAVVGVGGQQVGESLADGLHLVHLRSTLRQACIAFLKHHQAVGDTLLALDETVIDSRQQVGILCLVL